MKKKQLTFLFLLFLTLGLILPNYNLTLGNGDWVQSYIENPTMGFEEGADSWANRFLNPIAKGVFSALIGGIFMILIAITSAFLGLGQFLLNLVTSPTFIDISFTGADNPFVTEGWRIVKDLTNVCIILGLVVIALATILRISSYQMKKTLPLFIIVALLINFTPMLCGLVIDASNIIMNHFLKGGALLTGGFISRIEVEVGNLFNLKDPAETFGRGALFLGFNVFGGLIFLLFACLFLFRYVALWMLVILSPFALFCLIFPNTKKMWDMWLSQFIQWCFIGIPVAFTIYLANIITVELIEGGMIEGVSGGAEILGYLVPLTFLIFGFFMSLQIGAVGASTVTNLGKWAGTTGLPRLGGGIGAGAIGLTKGIKEGKGVWGKIKGAGRGAFTAEGREEGKEVVDRALERMHVVRPGFYMERKLKREKLDEEEKRMKPLPSDELERIAFETRAITHRDKRAKAIATKLLGDRGDFAAKGTPEEVKRKEQEAINVAKKMGADLSGLSKSRPELTPEVNSEKFQEQLQAEIEDFQKKNPGFTVTATVIEKREKIVRRNMIREQVGKISAKNFTEKVSSNSPKNLDVFLGMTAAQIENVGTYGSEEKIKAIEDTYKNNVKEISVIYNRFKREGKTREAQRLADLVRKMGKDPNFSI